MKTSFRTFLLPLLALSLFTACNKNIEEFYFVGHPVGAEICSATEVGYLIELDYPTQLGDTLTAYGALRHNAVMAYRAPRKLTDGETIYGVAYMHKGFAALNCVGLYNYQLPEMVCLSVDEDSAHVMQEILAAQSAQ